MIKKPNTNHNYCKRPNIIEMHCKTDGHNVFLTKKEVQYWSQYKYQAYYKGSNISGYKENNDINGGINNTSGSENRMSSVYNPNKY